MKLHRVGKKPDWEKLRDRQRNFWQRLAVRTHSIVTPANIISILGLVLVVTGLVQIYDQEFWSGLAYVIVGRIFDILDGVIADKTGTKSHLGEVVDGTIDKLQMAIALPILVLASVLFWWQAVILFVLHSANALAGLVIKLRGGEFHTSRMGKYATTAQWEALALYLLLKALGWAGATLVLAHVVFAISVLMGIQASRGYAKQFLYRT